MSSALRVSTTTLVVSHDVRSRLIIALAGRSTDLADSFRNLLKAGNSPGLLAILAAVIPPLRAFVNRVRTPLTAAQQAHEGRPSGEVGN